MAEQAPESLRGKTIRWTFEEGPTQGVVFEHQFHQDGSVEFTVVEGKGEGQSGRSKECAMERVTGDVHVTSYLASSGYTLTVVLNFADGTALSFASNDKSWFPARGTFEVVR